MCLSWTIFRCFGLNVRRVSIFKYYVEFKLAYLGKYKIRSAKTKPTGKNKLEAGTNGKIIKRYATKRQLETGS